MAPSSMGKIAVFQAAEQGSTPCGATASFYDHVIVDIYPSFSAAFLSTMMTTAQRVASASGASFNRQDAFLLRRS